MCLSSRDRFLRALRAEPVDRPPVWIMRQAGRTLPGYRSLREKHSFWELCTTPHLAATVSLEPLRLLEVDAAIVFSDILVIPAVLGQQVLFEDGPRVDPPIRESRDVDALRTPDVRRDLGYVAEALRALRAALGDTKALLGFVGAPFTLACYMVERSGRSAAEGLKRLLATDPVLGARLLDHVADAVIEHARLQLDAGADAVQLFDTWAGELSPEDYRTYALPSVRRIVRSVPGPVIYYVNGIGSILEDAASTGAAVLGVDWRIELGTVRARLGEDHPLQGNLDPMALLGPAPSIRARVREMIRHTRGRAHIVNLGHGVLPDTPLASLEVFVRSVVEWSSHDDVA